MKAGGLDYSCYYHIRDYHVDHDRFAKFMSPVGAALMARWWNRSSQWDGLFDFQNRVRPSYYAFKLLSRLTGERLRLDSTDAAVHGFATWDPKLLVYNVLLWNYSTAPRASGSDRRRSAVRSHIAAGGAGCRCFER